MALANLITTHAAEAAAAGDWAGVAAVLNAPRQRARETRAGYLEVLQALGESDFRHTIEVFSSDTIGKRGVAMLEDPDDRYAGLRFAHPTTIGLINGLAAQLRPGVADKLLALGFTVYTLASDAGLEIVTAEQCQDAWGGRQLSVLLQSLQQQFDAIKNQIGTAEQSEAVAALRSMADALEAA